VHNALPACGAELWVRVSIVAVSIEGLIAQELVILKKLGIRGNAVSVEEARTMINTITSLTRAVLLHGGFLPQSIQQITTKLRDAGRRSPPWRPASAKVPGRPQDGADGNRRLRWLFDTHHKFYADEKTATLVEVKYYLQLLSMSNAPALPRNTIQDRYGWLTGHVVVPGAYCDPIQLIPIDLKEVATDRRAVQSGHLIPLDRGGRHEPKNSFLMLSRSNQLQGNLTVHELLNLMSDIVQRHKMAQASRTAPEQRL
jgi:hypothetical protein